MRPALAAATIAAILLISYFGAPVVPVLLGAALAFGWSALRVRARRGAP